MKSDKQKELLLEQLKKTPIVQIACEKNSVSRATYYRWRKDNPDFAKAADEAINEGLLLINDLSESQLISAIRDKNLGAIVFWLKHHHPAYATRVEIDAKIKQIDERLTPEQEALIQKALRLISCPEQRPLIDQSHD